MIVNYDSPGQLCNRIWSLLPSIAYGLEYKEKVLLINFDEYSSDFENLNKNKYVRFSSRKFFKRCLMSMKARGYIQNGRSNLFLKLFGLNFIEGWSNRLGNSEMVVNQSETIRDIFSFRTNLRSDIDNLFSKAENTVIVGVHIRRGDYQTWNDGIYYYSDNDYLRVMKELKKEFEERGEQVKFLLCSNDKLDLHNFEEIDCFIIPDSSGAKDLYALSRCSYIVGPPSSYSQWASFLGEVPLRFIMTVNDTIKLSDFSQIISLNKQLNGNTIDID